MLQESAIAYSSLPQEEGDPGPSSSRTFVTTRTQMHPTHRASDCYIATGAVGIIIIIAVSIATALTFAIHHSNVKNSGFGKIENDNPMTEHYLQNSETGGGGDRSADIATSNNTSSGVSNSSHSNSFQNNNTLTAHGEILHVNESVNNFNNSSVISKDKNQTTDNVPSIVVLVNTFNQSSDNISSYYNNTNINSEEQLNQNNETFQQVRKSFIFFCCMIICIV